ncbi:hypothetical protein Agau_P200473 (plasmid) [Agrobacterium tumefaciens F2]|uniref:Uncharacterized protein n=1 Tax=Brucella lupini TaxID=255457 RepID=A0A256H0M7_9HYPH|nr:hypothetical protein Agau_P200473 [Agrobacterium tumefaciens F2]OYR32700.1 hypothetical protein CES86_5580 [Brucella lupini]
MAPLVFAGLIHVFPECLVAAFAICWQSLPLAASESSSVAIL